jgi:hypothetical protein
MSSLSSSVDSGLLCVLVLSLRAGKKRMAMTCIFCHPRVTRQQALVSFLPVEQGGPGHANGGERKRKEGEELLVEVS